MSEDPLISVKDISKAYRIWKTPAARLVSPLLAWSAGLCPTGSRFERSLQEGTRNQFRDFYALRNISFSVARGESVGIIGRNGSGKSTLLQILAGTLKPSTGEIKTTGRVAALLELGSGFNPEFTGRENVYLNATILGLPRTKIHELFESIATFADIGDFIEQPVKTYSSGMMIRLAFAVAVMVEPEILIVDEALSVGDVFFQQKCFRRVHEMLERGTSLIFVSHDTAAVQNMCDRAILLHQGEAVYQGLPEECTSRYYARFAADPSAPASVGTKTTVVASERSKILECNILESVRSRHGERQMEFVAACITNLDGRTIQSSTMMEKMQFHLLVRANQNVAHPACGLHIFDRMNNLVFGCGTPQLQQPMPAMSAGAEIALTFTLTCSLQPGSYTFNVAVAEPTPENLNLATFFDVCEGLGPIEIIPPASGAWPFYGIANLPMTVVIHHD